MRTIKKSAIALSLVLATVSAFAQGTVRFHNRPASGDARVVMPDGTGPGDRMIAQLFLVGPGGGLTPLTPTATFRTTSAAAAFFINEVIVSVPGIPAGSPATVRMRAFMSIASSWEAAVAGGFYRGESGDITIAQLGGTPSVGAPIPDPELTGLQGFSYTGTVLPEPSTMALGLLGAAALLLRRRK